MMNKSTNKKKVLEMIDEVHTLLSIISYNCDEEMRAKLGEEREFLDFPSLLTGYSKLFSGIIDGSHFKKCKENKKIFNEMRMTAEYATSEIEAILCEGEFVPTFEEVKADIESILKPLNKEQRLKAYKMYKQFTGDPIPGERKGMQALFKKLAK